MLPGLLSAEPFVPHSYAHIVEAGVFPAGAVPEAAYGQMLTHYAALRGVQVSRITYENDGLKVTGLAVLPASITPGSHPILIYNRGGSGEYGKLTVLSALKSMVLFAQEGYLVFASNYRGNDGGEGRDEFGGADVRDVLRLMEIAQKHPGWDGENCYMLGHSRGAMMLYLALKSGLKINAGAALAGVADLLGDLKSDPKMENLYQRRIPGYLERPQECLRERSALCWPEALSAPLLLLHGTSDPVVDHSQSERLAAALGALGKPHELHLYEGGNHALVRQWDDVIMRVHAWLEEFRA